MLEMFQSHDGVFFQLFEQAAENNHNAAKLLYQLCKDYKNPEKVAKKIHTLEHNGDDITHKAFFEIHKSFITPIDREDIMRLNQALDDVLDHIDESAANFTTYQIKKPTSVAKDMASIIVQATKSISTIIPKLRKRKHFSEIEKAIIEINKLENEGDVLFQSGIKSLFAKKNNPMDVMRLNAIYTSMEHATDACEKVAEILEGLIIKYA